MPTYNPYQRLINQLARVTTTGRRIGELDGLRFVAIFTVVIQHVYETIKAHGNTTGPDDFFAALVRDWRIGVDLFFVISGFILAMPFAAHHLLGEKKVNLGQYFLRRLTRLEPPYLITLALWYVVLIFYWKQSAAVLLPHLLASCFYVHNLVYAHTGYESWINSVAWSLEIEVQFYVVAPLLALVFTIRSKAARRALLLVVTAAWPQLFKAPGLAPLRDYYTLLISLPNFLMGFLLADLFLTDWRQQPRRSVAFDVCAAAGWLFLPFYWHWMREPLLGHRPPAIAWPFLLLYCCYCSFRGRFTARVLASSFIMTVGGMCYTIYLLHFPMIRILANYSPISPHLPIGLSSVLYTALWGSIVLMASIAFFLAVEKPCMRRDWPQRLLERLFGKTPAPRDAPQPTPAEQILDVPPESTTPLSENQPVP